MWTGHLRRQFDVISPSTNNPKIIQYSCCRSKYVVPNTANVLYFLLLLFGVHANVILK